MLRALVLWSMSALAHRPVPPELLDIKVVMASMKYPSHVLTAEGPYINSPEDKITLVRPIEHKHLERQLFTPYRTHHRGLLLMHKGFKAGMLYEDLILQHMPAPREYSNIILKKEDGPYPHMFRLISLDKCLSLAQNYREDGTFTPKFQKCEVGREDQIWKMFTEARALAYITDTRNYLDDMNESLSILVDDLNDDGRDLLEE